MIEFKCVITNGYCNMSTITENIKYGWKFVITIPAELVHPHALPTDKATIFSKYVSDEDQPVGRG